MVATKKCLMYSIYRPHLLLFTATLATFPDVCYHCGRAQPIYQGPDIDQLKQQFAVVRPICAICLENGKHP